MIAHDTNHRHIDEQDIHVRHIATFESFLSQSEPMVIHCPGLSYIIDNYPHCFVVWMLRPLSEIIASQQRIGLGEIKERTSYHALEDKRPIAQIKLDYWNEYQKHKLPNYLELEYNSLKNHPLWIDKKDRMDFDARQWRIG